MPKMPLKLAFMFTVAAISYVAVGQQQPLAGPAPAPAPAQAPASAPAKTAAAKHAPSRPRTAHAAPKKNAPSVYQLFRTARSFRYVDDSTNRDHWQNAVETDGKRSGDCEDKAMWLYTKMRECGYETTELMTGKYRSYDPTMHMWVQYTDPAGDLYLLDPTIQRRPWKMERVPRYFYLAGQRVAPSDDSR